MKLELKEVLSFNEAVEFLDVSKSFLYKMTASSEIMHFKPNGKLIYFKRQDLLDWIYGNDIEFNEVFNINKTKNENKK
jgi:excisionase family DNA binding protein